MRFVYCACAISALLDGDWRAVRKDRVVKYIRACMVGRNASMACAVCASHPQHGVTHTNGRLTKKTHGQCVTAFL
jgi:hypothetical protein